MQEVIKFKKCKLSYCNVNLFEKIESINNYMPFFTLIKIYF